MSELAERPRLEDLVAAIRRECGELELAIRTTFEHAVRIGQLLAQAKAQLQHGAWLPWLAQHTDISEQTAQRWMRLARAHAEDPSRVTGLGVKDALRAISAPRAETPLGRPASARGSRAEPPPSLQADVARSEARRRAQTFPRNGVERKTWREIWADLDERIPKDLKLATHDFTNDFSRAEALRAAAKRTRALADDIEALAREVHPPR